MSEPIVTTTSGKIAGRTADGISVFRGVPFAAPPVGPLRFRAPEPPDPWDGVRSCTAPGPACVQLDPPNRHPGLFEVMGAKSEDCLYLDVWTPGCDDARRPVLLWIHGGVFFMGAGSEDVYNGAKFASHGAVVVSINYRLGGLGFVYLDELFDGLSTANLGMLDQIRSLEWVRENIAAFGGDPDNVTIFGESAGGMSVSTLMAMPGARGLLRRASPQSGAGNNGLSIETATLVARRYLELVGIESGDIDALYAAPAERFVVDFDVIGELATVLEDPSATFAFPFQPVIDGATLPKLPTEAIRDGSARGIDLLVGTTAEEMRLAIWDMPWDQMGTTLEDALLQFADIGHLVSDIGRPQDEVEKIYEVSLEHLHETVTGPDLWAAIATDRELTVPAIRLAEAQKLHHDAVYVYRFAWRCPVDESLGAMHALDIPFFFDNIDDHLVQEHLVGTDPPQELADAMHCSLLAFAATGDPNHEGLPQWPAYDAARRATMIFDTPSRVIDDPEAERRSLYEGVL